MQNLTGITYLIIGSGLGILASWLPARYSWKSQRAEQRRANVYAPLFDELQSIKSALNEYRNPVRTEYERIRSQHLLYLVPRFLRWEIETLYIGLRSFGSSVESRQVEYAQRILWNLKGVDITPATSSIQSNATTLANDLGACLVAGEIQDVGKYKIDALFTDVKQTYQISDNSVDEYFKKLLPIREKDDRIPFLEEERRFCLEELESVGKAIAKDLDAQW